MSDYAKYAKLDQLIDRIGQQIERCISSCELSRSNDARESAHHALAVKGLAAAMRELNAMKLDRDLATAQMAPRQHVFNPPSNCINKDSCLVHGMCGKDPRCDGSSVVA